jgi:regulator of sirC expression with transglutaminase-like and TPR domain
MYTSPELALFALAVQKPEAEIDLGQAALLLGGAQGREPDLPKALASLDDLGAQAKRYCRAPGERAPQLARFLFEEQGFAGDADDYYDPENSFLDAVLERRRGIPISLSVLMMEVGRRAEIPIEGVSFPGHFLVRSPVRGGYLFFDPFARGRPISREDLRALYARFSGQDKDPEPGLLAAAPKKQILARMLQNLRAIYTRRGERKPLRFVLERLALLVPRDEEMSRELAALTRPSGSSDLN